MKTLTCLLALCVSLTSIAGTPKASADASTTKAAAKATPETAAHTIIADVDGIVCAFCVQGIQKIFQKKGKAEQIVISLELKKVFVTEKKGQSITDDEFRETIRQAGFKTQGITRSPLSIAEAKTRLVNKQPLVVTTKGGKPVQTVSR